MKARIPLDPENDTFDCHIQRLNKYITVPLKSKLPTLDWDT